VISLTQSDQFYNNEEQIQSGHYRNSWTKEIKLDDNTVLIAINTQWWNHPYKKPSPVDTECKITTEDDFLEELEDLIEDNEDKNVLIAGHYPFISMGEYGGRFPLIKHIFPPVIGSFLIAYRQNIGTVKDISNLGFYPFSQKLRAILSNHQSLIFLSGHEHNQMVLRFNENFIINSGASISSKYISKLKTSLHATSDPGLIEILFYDNGRIEFVPHYYKIDHFEFMIKFSLKRRTI